MKDNTYKYFHDFINMFGDEEDEKMEKIKLLLPHGSGINFDWEIIDKPNFWDCKNGFECLNNNGYYDGVIEFTVRIYKNPNRDFRIFLNGNKSHSLNRKYCVKDYLEETFYSCIKYLSMLQYEPQYKEYYIKANEIRRG